MPCAIAVDSLGNVYVAGYSWVSGTANDYAAIGYDVGGTLRWVDRYKGPTDIAGRARTIEGSWLTDSWMPILRA